MSEIRENGERENYSKILMQKSMFIHLPLQNQKRELNANDLEEWKRRQLAEREKIRLAESTPEPPERPPKRPDLGVKGSKSVLFTPKPYTTPAGGHITPVGNNMIVNPITTKSISNQNGLKKIKPLVPPKPVLTKETKTFLNCRRVSSNSSLSTSSSHLTTISESSLNENMSPPLLSSSHLSRDFSSHHLAPYINPNNKNQPKTTNIPITIQDNDRYTDNFSPMSTSEDGESACSSLQSADHMKSASADPGKTGLGPQHARLVRVDSQMSDYSVCDVNFDNAVNSSNYSGVPSSLHDVNQNVKSHSRFSPEKQESPEKVKIEEYEKIQAEKNLLISRIKSKLELLREERDLVKKEITENESAIEEIITKLNGIARIRDIDRIRRHSEEVGSLASLIQCLSYRLEKLENDKSPHKSIAALQNGYNSSKLYGGDQHMNTNKTTSSCLRLSPLSYRQQEEKLSKLQSQLEDAKQLRELSNKRRINLTKMISELLEEKDGTMFSFCMKEKTRLTLELREFDDKMKSGEEHLNNLMSI